MPKLPLSEANTGGNEAEMTEDQFLALILDYAIIRGWKRAHFRPARVIRNGRETWRTAVQGDGKGFPDLVLAKRGHMLIIAELKKDKGELTIHQHSWRDVLTLVPGVVYQVWRPKDWETGKIRRILDEGAGC